MKAHWRVYIKINGKEKVIDDERVNFIDFSHPMWEVLENQVFTKNWRCKEVIKETYDIYNFPKGSILWTEWIEEA
jgi:hypothetical protein